VYDVDIDRFMSDVSMVLESRSSSSVGVIRLKEGKKKFHHASDRLFPPSCDCDRRVSLCEMLDRGGWMGG